MEHTLSDPSKPNHLSVSLGFWSALLGLGTFLVFTVCFVVAYATPAPFTWTSMRDYLAYAQGANQTAKQVAQLMMLLFAPLYVVLMNSIYDLADRRRSPSRGLHCCAASCSRPASACSMTTSAGFTPGACTRAIV